MAAFQSARGGCIWAPDDTEGMWYLGEDFAFCEQARQCGLTILADTTVRLKHYGSYGYSWEEAGTEVKRYGTFRFRTR